MEHNTQQGYFLAGGFEAGLVAGDTAFPLLLAVVMILVCLPPGAFTPNPVFFGGATVKSPSIITVPGEDLVPKNPALLDDIVRQAEGRLQAQLQSAIAADNRAMVLASIQAAGSAALVVAGAQDDLAGAAELAAYAAAAVLFVGACFAAWSARPVPFGWVGSNPIDWVDAIKTDEDLTVCRAFYASHLDEYLRCNDRFVRTNAEWTKRALMTLVAAPLIAGLAVVLDHVF